LTRFTDLVKVFENTPKPRKITIGGSPQMVIGGGPEIRIGVYTDLFERLKKQFEKVKV